MATDDAKLAEIRRSISQLYHKSIHESGLKQLTQGDVNFLLSQCEHLLDRLVEKDELEASQIRERENIELARGINKLYVQALGDIKRKDEVLTIVADAIQRAIALLEKYGYVFRRAPSEAIQQLQNLSDGEQWEHLAFALYTEIAWLSNKAKQALVLEKE